MPCGSFVDPSSVAVFTQAQLYIKLATSYNSPYNLNDVKAKLRNPLIVLIISSHKVPFSKLKISNNVDIEYSFEYQLIFNQIFITAINNASMTFHHLFLYA